MEKGPELFKATTKRLPLISTSTDPEVKVHGINRVGVQRGDTIVDTSKLCLTCQK